MIERIALTLPPAALDTPYLGNQLGDAGFWSHTDNGVLIVRDAAAQAWADSFDWLADAKQRHKQEVNMRVARQLSMGREDRLGRDHEHMVRRVRQHARLEPDRTFYVPVSDDYVQQTGHDVIAAHQTELDYEQTVHAFAHDLCRQTDNAASMVELRHVREVIGHQHNWPQQSS